MSDLLLADEEMYRSENKTTGGFLDLEKVRKAQLAKAEPLIRADERKKVGKWLARTVIEAGLSADLFEGIESLKKGKSPEEAKS